ncbi:MAG: hypothetical protein HYX68_26860 [Planctomycetes bacterium]|jgi:hypothetical protein|nr:hypothetical protein [Planctomycetota bacterium]
MMKTVADAKAFFENEGLYVSTDKDRSLWIATNVRDAGNGVLISDHACSLIKGKQEWTAVFPAEASCTFQISGALPELAATISVVFAKQRVTGDPLRDAFRQVVPDSERLIARQVVAHV